MAHAVAGMARHVRPDLVAPANQALLMLRVWSAVIDSDVGGTRGIASIEARRG